MRAHYSIVSNTTLLLQLLPAIQSLGDAEKDALGFIPARAYEEAITRRRLLAATVNEGGTTVLAGYLLFSGVFPHAKVQQIAAVPSYRRRGAAAALMRAFTSDLERVGYMAIRADVASDLSAAQSFYERHGFQLVREKAGGAARKRTIRIYSKTLDSDTLFTAARAQQQIGISIKTPRPGRVPVFAFDLNVYFDLVRDRNQSADARLLFSEALGHTLRLAVADEFVTELRKTSTGTAADPVLQLALQLPRLPKPDADALSSLADQIHDLIFVKAQHRDAGTSQAKSDARHVAHAALAKAAAFITRDGPILNARQELLRDFGIDIATVAEIVDLIPTEAVNGQGLALQGEGYAPVGVSIADFSRYCTEAALDSSQHTEFSQAVSSGQIVRFIGIMADTKTVGVGALVVPRSVEPVARMLVHVHHEAADAEAFADYLLETLLRAACEGAASAIELVHLPGQSIVNKLAMARGFHRGGGAHFYSKIAIGKPLTAANWLEATQQIRRRTNLVLPAAFTSLASGIVEVTLPDGGKTSIAVDTLESLLGPTIIVWPGRDGVLVPIARQYADELLGTSDQPTLGFIANKDAAFLSLRGYVNSPRTAKLMRPGTPIIFYESKRSGNGRGAAVAVARIVSSVVVRKTELNASSDKRLVIEDAGQFSATDDVLLTTFDNLLPFPRLVPIRRLKQLGAVGGANLVSAQPIPNNQITMILTDAWAASNAQ
jgi:ribosomal protein S18 acetylase RimI-like enzyme